MIGTGTASDVCVFVLAGGKGSRLHELTELDCKPSVAFGGHYRIIDFALANADNSGLRNVLVATQYQPRRLHGHLLSRWHGRLLRGGGSLGILYGGQDGYSGTAHAVEANLRYIEAMNPRHVLVLAADHVYQMDFRRLLEDHERAGAAVTIAATEVPLDSARNFGVIGADDSGGIDTFEEKPENPKPMPGTSATVLASMGIYMFSWPALRKALSDDMADSSSSHDFGKDILPKLVAEGRAAVHRFRQPRGSRVISPYWRDVGTLDSLLTAHEEYFRYGDSVLDFAAWPIGICEVSHHPHWPDAASHRWLSGVSPDADVSARARLDRSIVMPAASVGSGCRLTRTIVAPGTRLPDGLVIGENPHEDEKWFRRTSEGTVLVTDRMVQSWLSYRQAA